MGVVMSGGYARPVNWRLSPQGGAGLHAAGSSSLTTSHLIDAILVEVEVDIRSGLPGFSMVICHLT